MIIISLEHNTTIRNMYYQVFPELNSKAARFPFDKTFSIQKLLSILDSAPTHLLQDVMEIVLLSLNKYEPFKGKNRRRRRRRKPSDRNEKHSSMHTVLLLLKTIPIIILTTTIPNMAILMGTIPEKINLTPFQYHPQMRILTVKRSHSGSKSFCKKKVPKVRRAKMKTRTPFRQNPVFQPH